jgi:predicted transcriptional regulator
MYSIDVRHVALFLYNKINNIREVASMINISKSTISRWFNLSDITLINFRRIRHKLTSIIINFIKHSIQHNPYQTIHTIKNKILKKF